MRTANDQRQSRAILRGLLRNLMQPKGIGARANGAVVRNMAGLRCIPIELCQELVAERDERLAAEHDRLRAQRAQQKLDAEEQQAERQAQRARREAIRLAQAGLVAEGHSAVETMMLTSGEFEERAAKSPTSDYLSGDMSYLPIKERR